MPVTLPERPLTVLWQSTVVDLEPGTRHGHRYDGAAVNTTLAVLNDTAELLVFPLILATTDPETHDRARGAVLPPEDDRWETLAGAIRANALAQGYSAARIDDYLVSLRRSVARASKSEAVTLAPGEQRFVRTHGRKLLRARGGVFEFRAMVPLPQFALVSGGSISVAVVLPATTPRFTVELLDWTRTVTPQAFGSDAGLPALAKRLTLAWSSGDDPELAVSYRYA